jgi:hypothetical protein
MTTVNPNMLPAGYLQAIAQAPGTAYGSTGINVPVPSIQDQRIALQPQQQQQQAGAGGMGKRLKDDVKMQTVLRSGATGPQAAQGHGQRAEEQGGPQQMALWEREILASQEVKRKVKTPSSILYQAHATRIDEECLVIAIGTGYVGATVLFGLLL